MNNTTKKGSAFLCASFFVVCQLFHILPQLLPFVGSSLFSLAVEILVWVVDAAMNVLISHDTTMHSGDTYFLLIIILFELHYMVYNKV